MNKSIDYNKFFSDLNITKDLKVEEDLGSGFVRLKISEAERRQAFQDIRSIEDIVLECLRNSRDAESRNIFIATKKIGEKKRLIYIIDDGKGIPEKFHKMIFQSRVTSKLENAVKDTYGFHGRGMALFSIKLNVDDIKIVYSDLFKGTSIFIQADTEIIPEKKDQSVLPVLVNNNDCMKLEGGTNNIIKTVMEFSIQSPDINIYLGSPTQIIAAMIDSLLLPVDEKARTQKNNKQKSSYDDRAVHDINSLKVSSIEDLKTIIEKYGLKITEFPVFASNFTILSEILEKYYNMNISERGVQRVFYGEIVALKPFNRYFHHNLNISNKNKISLKKTQKVTGTLLHDERDLANRFKDEDIRYIIDLLRKTINQRGDKYLLTLDDDIEVKKSNNTINLKIYLRQKS